MSEESYERREGREQQRGRIGLGHGERRRHAFRVLAERDRRRVAVVAGRVVELDQARRRPLDRVAVALAFDAGGGGFRIAVVAGGAGAKACAACPSDRWCRKSDVVT